MLVLIILSFLFAETPDLYKNAPYLRKQLLPDKIEAFKDEFERNQSSAVKCLNKVNDSIQKKTGQEPPNMMSGRKNSAECTLSGLPLDFIRRNNPNKSEEEIKKMERDHLEAREKCSKLSDHLEILEIEEKLFYCQLADMFPNSERADIAKYDCDNIESSSMRLTPRQKTCLQAFKAKNRKILDGIKKLQLRIPIKAEPKDITPSGNSESEI